MTLVRNAPQKPMKGAYLLERKQLHRKHKARESAVLSEAKARDGHRCRVPRCPYRSMPVDGCHETHRGMGGNPKEDRTALDGTWTLCRIHHGLWDRGDLHIEPLTPLKASGACAYYLRAESGRPECIGIESRIGVSSPRT